MEITHRQLRNKTWDLKLTYWPRKTDKRFLVQRSAKYLLKRLKVENYANISQWQFSGESAF